MVGFSRLVLQCLMALLFLNCAAPKVTKGQMLVTQKLSIQWGVDSIEYANKRHVDFEEHCESSGLVCEFGQNNIGHCIRRFCGKVEHDTMQFAQPTFWFDQNHNKPVKVSYCNDSKYYEIQRNMGIWDLRKEYGFQFKMMQQIELGSQPGVLLLKDDAQQVSIRVEGVWVSDIESKHSGIVIPNKLVDGLSVDFCRKGFCTKHIRLSD